MNNTFSDFHANVIALATAKYGHKRNADIEIVWTCVEAEAQGAFESGDSVDDFFRAEFVKEMSALAVGFGSDLSFDDEADENDEFGGDFDFDFEEFDEEPEFDSYDEMLEEEYRYSRDYDPEW